MFDLATFGVLGAIGAAIAMGWSHIKVFADRFMALFIVQLTVDGYAESALSAYAWSHFKRSPSGSRTYGAYLTLRKSTRKQDVFPYEAFGAGSLLLWDGYAPIIVTRVEDKQNFGETMHLTFFRGTVDPDALVVRAINHYKKLISNSDAVMESRFAVYSFVGKSSKMSNDRDPGELARAPSFDPAELAKNRFVIDNISDIGEASKSPLNALDGLALTPELLVKIDEAAKWHDNRQWYEERGIPWRRGWLLHGKPGNGKTTLARAVAQKLGIPICVFNVASMDNDEFEKHWQDMQKHMPCVVLFEDFDNVFDGRRNICAGNDSNMLSFDTVLNCIAGVRSAEGIFLIVTTNNVDKIDPALGIPDATGNSTRPGRLDDCIEVCNPTAEQREQIAIRLLGLTDRTHEIVEAGRNDSSAQFVARCTKLALSNFWNRQ